MKASDCKLGWHIYLKLLSAFAASLQEKHIMAPNRLGSCLWRVSTSLLLFLAASTISATSSVDNGKLFTVNGINYYSGDAVSRVVTSDFDSTRFDAIVPLTVIRTDEALLTMNIVKETISNYSITDDVFQAGFLQGG